SLAQAGTSRTRAPVLLVSTSHNRPAFIPCRDPSGPENPLVTFAARFANWFGHAVRSRPPLRRARRRTAQPRVELLETRVLLDFGLSVGSNVLVRAKPGNQSETSIAINPTNSLNV